MLASWHAYVNTFARFSFPDTPRIGSPNQYTTQLGSHHIPSTPNPWTFRPRPSQLNWELRYFVLRTASYVLLCAFISGASAGLAQDSSSTTPAQSPASAPDSDAQSLPAEVVAAEAAIATSDWKTAEAKLAPWLATHPGDARALFDAGYVADAQNRVDDAAGLYQRATDANPDSFEAHLLLGLLLARQGKPAEARPHLLAATKLNPGVAGPALKARAWRALA
jgi:tetratricopeptide (TPR) repeat protein